MSSRHLKRQTKTLPERETSCRRISKSRSWVLKTSTNRGLHMQFATTRSLPEGTPVRLALGLRHCVYRKLKLGRSGGEVVCRGKARFLRGCKSLPARVAPAGSNRSRREGDDLSEASGGKGHLVTPRVCGL